MIVSFFRSRFAEKSLGLRVLPVFTSVIWEMGHTRFCEKQT